MNEKLLHYIWQYQCYNTSSLLTTDEQELTVISRGNYNSNQGPDFLTAKIKIDNAIWAGNIELHVLSSDWKKHRHQEDKNYHNVILHVVWKHDEEIGENFPTLELQERVPKLLLNKYELLSQNRGFIPCENQIKSVETIIIRKWKERLLMERLQEKSLRIDAYLNCNHYHWEVTLWWMLAENFGMKVNGEGFISIARSVPYNILQRHKNSLFQLEAFLFGQSRILDNEYHDEYMKTLQREYAFLQNKYGLIQSSISLSFLRMRPANFPTIRLAQLAALLQTTDGLFAKLLQENEINRFMDNLMVATSDYWTDHYMPDIWSTKKIKKTGEQMIQHIMINSVIPVLYCYGCFNDEKDLQMKAIDWLEQLSPEKNTITVQFERFNIENNSAFDSQALIQLKNLYCSKNKCLECGIGNAILMK
jgi:hypothetical protein